MVSCFLSGLRQKLFNTNIQIIDIKKIITLEQQLEKDKNRLNEIKESSISVREKRASANATIVGLNKRKRV